MLDGEFINSGNSQVKNEEHFDNFAQVQWSRAAFGPYSVGRRVDFEATFDVVERELWDAFGLGRRSSLKDGIPAAFGSVGL